IGRRHMENVAAMDRVGFAAAADLHLAAAEAFAREFAGSYATADPDRLLEDPAIDAVVIATHHHSHPPLALRAPAAGKHILLEKPMAVTVEECRCIQDAAVRANVTLSVNFKFRRAPAVLKAREAIPNPIAICGQLAMNPMPPGLWVRDPKKGGGLILAT